MHVAVELDVPTVRVTAEHSMVLPCVKITLPVGTTLPVGAVTLAVKVTTWFTDAVGSEDDNPVVAPVLPTDSVMVAVPVKVKFGSPL